MNDVINELSFLQVKFQFSSIIYLYSRYQIQEVLIINESEESTCEIVCWNGDRVSKKDRKDNDNNFVNESYLLLGVKL